MANLTFEVASKEYEHLPFSRLFQTYISRFSELRDFFGVDPFDDTEITEYLNNYRFEGDRRRLVASLNEFNKPYQLHQNSLDNIKALQSDDSVTVTTGQQLMILGGPLFTIFKTMTVIHQAKRMERLSGRKVVPVFWLADEDHDFEEVASVTIPAGDTLKKIDLPDGVSKIREAVSRIALNGSYDTFLKEVKSGLPETDFSKELWELVENAYKEPATFKAGFARILSSIFSEYGLIFAGSDFPPFKKAAADVLKTAVGKASELQAVLTEQSRAIAGRFHAQAQVQDSLLFYHDEEFGRERLHRVDDTPTWQTEHGGSWSVSELQEQLNKHPENYSPNVFLRPILQDRILPNVAYIGGPGEIGYYAQMKKLYEVFDMRMPPIIPRLSATLVEHSIQRILDNLPFSVDDYHRRVEDLEKEWVEKKSEDDLEGLFLSWKEEVDRLTDSKIDIISQYDASLKGSAGKLTSDYHKGLDKLSQKLRKSIKQKDEIQIRRIHKIKAALFPNNNMQEREIAMMFYMNKYGSSLWKNLLQATENENINTHKVIYFKGSG